MKQPIVCCMSIVVLLLAACGGGGGGSQPAAPSVTLSGRITFDRVPFKATLGTGLDFGGVIESPARGVVVEAIDGVSGATLATATTDTDGGYGMTVPGNRDVFVRAKAQMVATGSPAWNFRVLNNTNGNALYVLDGQVFNTGAGAVTRNLRAISGWSGVAYTGTRAAAPFAILDTVYRAKELLLSAQANLSMPALDVYWSASNQPASPFCPSLGNIVSTAYQRNVSNDCVPSSVSPTGIYVQGGTSDTDEFDQSVVAHEFAHYVEATLGRSDSVGGSHAVFNRLDMRVAFSEGWGNAFSAMVLNDPIYRDSNGGANADTYVDIEAGPDPNAGWFSEETVQQIIWDAFDTTNDSGDGITLGFTPIFQTMIGSQQTTLAFTGLHSFIAGLKAAAPTAASAIDSLLTAPPRNITGTGDFAVGETNNGGVASVLPIYLPLQLNQPTGVICTSAQFGSFNKLANRLFFRLDIVAPTAVTITVTAAPAMSALPASDPDAVLWRQGVRVWTGNSFPTTTPANEQTVTPLTLTSGTYLLEVYDYLYANPGSPVFSSTPRCMTVSATS